MYYRLFSKFLEKSFEKMCLEIKEFIKKGEKILDLGCGSGILAKKLKEKFESEVFGLDIEDRRVCNIPFRIFDGKKIPFASGSFDTVLISFVLHHAESPLEILREGKRVGKKIIIFEDLPEGLFSKIRCYLHWLSWNLFFGKKFIRFNFFPQREWVGIFRELNLRLIAEKDFFIPFKFLDPAKRKIFVLEK